MPIKGNKNVRTYVGRSVGRHGGRALVRGRSLFAEDDLLPKEALVLKVLRSKKHHARILSIDTAKARGIRGVTGILTASDIPGINQYGVIIKDQPLLAEDKVRFAGEAIALVAAENEEVAEEALQAIAVKFQDLPPVFDPESALASETALVHKKGNLLSRKTVRKGDVEEGFKRSDIVVERTYHTQLAEHGYLEPDAGNGTIDKNGNLIIRVCTQNPHYDRKDVAALLGLEEERIRIVQTTTGGGFGSKLDLTVQGFIGLALYHFQRPVRMVFSREEAFIATSKRHPSRIHLKSGVSKDGKLLSLQARMLFDTGPYSSYGMPLTMRAAIQITGPYKVENVDVESISVYTNNPVAGAMRGVSVVQTTFASESQMDILARKVGMNPLEFRKINAMKPGSKTATGQQLTHSVGFLKTLNSLQPAYSKAISWKKEGRPGHIKRGVGIGSMWYGIGSMSVKNPSHATIKVDEKGRITLCTGAADIGQGSTTILCQIIREILGVEPGFIRMVTADTGRTLDAGPTSASRQTYISGNAVLNVSKKMAEDLLDEASQYLNRPKKELSLKDSYVVDTNDNRLMLLTEMLERMTAAKGPLQWEGCFDPVTTKLDPETGQGVPFATYTFASHLAMVEADEKTGKVQAVKVVAAQDVGKAINPQAIMGQIQGGIGMGLGFALMEEFLPGKTFSMNEYYIPTSLDMPQIECIIVEAPEPTGPFGAKGMGEPSLAPTAPAILNAIADSLGTRVYHLPAKAEVVRAAVRRAEL
ncbi:xanthine dehydrogenase family protein molybdopterin-binding subunit [Desulfococcaceae bacterium HSG9]|nr:xanthine dehydrogenase family protein molybdopterin-binding subunit [Desulfococcaceae bacterium HSG9]